MRGFVASDNDILVSFENNEIDREALDSLLREMSRQGMARMSDEDYEGALIYINGVVNLMECLEKQEERAAE